MDWVYMFKDPFSPDHTQKLEDERLRYFKENCKNPKMVSHGSLIFPHDMNTYELKRQERHFFR